MDVGLPVWIGFNLLILALLALDLGVFHRETRAINIRESLTWSVIWVVVALIFNVVVYYWLGSAKAIQFFTGYLIERALSVDNIFVFLLIFSYFKVSAEYQYRVLFWGILGALIMRALMIAVGVTLINAFHWVIYVFGAFLIVTGIKMAIQEETEIHPDNNPVVRAVRKIMPVASDYHGTWFFTRQNGKVMATPLLVVLLVVETTDLVFALDSIPAILAVTRDSFIVYSSNVFAILGLRALYFALAGAMELFHYLKYGLAVILSFVGLKMLIEAKYEIPIHIALGVIVAVLLLSIIASLLRPVKQEVELPPGFPDEDDPAQQG